MFQNQGKTINFWPQSWGQTATNILTDPGSYYIIIAYYILQCICSVSPFQLSFSVHKLSAIGVQKPLAAWLQSINPHVYGKEKIMASTKSVYNSRSAVDRRSPFDRRILDMGPGYPGYDRRGKIKERRRSWEDRFSWERITKWSSAPSLREISWKWLGPRGENRPQILTPLPSPLTPLTSTLTFLPLFHCFSSQIYDTTLWMDYKRCSTRRCMVINCSLKLWAGISWKYW